MARTGQGESHWEHRPWQRIKRCSKRRASSVPHTLESTGSARMARGAHPPDETTRASTEVTTMQGRKCLARIGTSLDPRARHQHMWPSTRPARPAVASRSPENGLQFERQPSRGTRARRRHVTTAMGLGCPTSPSHERAQTPSRILRCRIPEHRQHARHHSSRIAGTDSFLQRFRQRQLHTAISHFGDTAGNRRPHPGLLRRLPAVAGPEFWRAPARAACKSV